MSTAGEFAPFRPRRARTVALTLMTAISLGGIAFAVTIRGFGLIDRLGVVLLAGLIAGFLYRQSSVRAVPSGEGLYVRNLFLNRQLEWAEILGVRLGDNPWVTLDLSDGDTLSVMGIQRSDGVERSRAEAARLAALVDRHSRPVRH